MVRVEEVFGLVSEAGLRDGIVAHLRRVGVHVNHGTRSGTALSYIQRT
jgi:hypothetical protein